MKDNEYKTLLSGLESQLVDARREAIGVLLRSEATEEQGAQLMELVVKISEITHTLEEWITGKRSNIF